MTFPLLLAYESRTAAILESINERLPGNPRDLPHMRRDIAFRQTVVHSQTALALISTHPDEPTTEIVILARHAVAQCRSSGTDPDVELSPLPSDTPPRALLVVIRCKLVQSQDIARFALEAAVDSAAASLG